MAVITLTSSKGAPGVTTTALALALIWPRPSLLIEADVAGSSSVLAGYFRGEVRHDRGLVDLAQAHRRGELTEGLHRASLPLGSSQSRVVPGLRTSAQAGTVQRLWEPIAAVLRGLESAGTDVIVDAGRVGAVGAPVPLLREADLTLLVTRSTMPAIAGVRASASSLQEDLSRHGTGADGLGVLMVGEGQPFSRREATSIIKLPVVAAVAWDPANAEVIALGKPPPVDWQSRILRRGGSERWQSSRFVRSAAACASTMEQLIEGRRQRLAPGSLVSDVEEAAR